MKCYLIMPQDCIVEERVLHLYSFESKTELTDDQLSSLYYESLPEGKRRKSGTLELEDIPQPSSDELAIENLATSKVTRDSALSDVVTVFNVEWQCTDDASDIRRVIHDATMINATDDTTTMFRLADNSWRETSLAELKQVLIAHIERKADVWAKFAEWDAGDKREPFNY